MLITKKLITSYQHQKITLKMSNNNKTISYPHLSTSLLILLYKNK